MDKKICIKCGDEKFLSEFTERKESKDGYYNTCKECRKLNQIEYRKTDEAKEIDKRYRYSEKRKQSQRKYKDSEKGKKTEKIYTQSETFKKNSKINRKKYQQSDKGKEFYRKRLKRNDNYRIASVLRSRVYHALKSQNAVKCAKTFNLLGCSINELRQHLESKFQENMNWKNHGEWHIDHIKPCMKFDLKNENQQKECFHYSNLQPLWAIDNLKKGAKVL